MASKSLIRPAFVCANCRHRLATSFLLRTRHSGSNYIDSPRRIPQQQIAFHSSRLETNRHTEKTNPIRNSEQPQLTDLEQLEASFDDTVDSNRKETPNEPAENAVTTTPWYLQDQSHQKEPENPFLERQKLPDLPSNPPPILEPLLNHLSVELGLDYLTMLDLRTMDPPPALGANLVMLFGSARSLKHLNVSGDRLCRWLRSNYKLRPIADGLLGRNEIKLKMKRKNRKAKTMSAAGAVYNPDPDDGITTGWICVNVGSVENGPESQNSADVSESFGIVGFGPTSDRAKIVIQLMTEDRRDQLDLEALWQSALNGSNRKQAKIQRARTSEPDVQESQDQELNESWTSQSSPQSIHKSQSSVTLNAPQIRNFHTNRRSYSPQDTSTLQNYSVESQESNIVVQYSPDIHDLEQTAPRRMSAWKDSKSAAMLRHKLNWLKAQKEAEAFSHLSKNQENSSPTSFYSRFFKSFPSIPLPEHLLVKVELNCYAVKIGHPQYAVQGLLKLLRELQACAMIIPERTFIQAFEAILLAPANLDKTKPSKDERMSTMNHKLEEAFEVLELMEFHGYDARSNQVFITLHNTIVKVADYASEYTPDTNKPIKYYQTRTASVQAYGLEDGIQKRRGSTPTALKLSPKQQKFYSYLFSKALEEIYTPKDPTDNSLYLHLMQSYLYNDPPAWHVFWRLWHHLACIMHRRIPEMYALVFKTVAEKSYGSRCQNDLMLLFSEMSREDPPVECTEEVAGALMQCLIKAEVARDGRPWDSMWAAAEKGLQRRI